MVLPEERVQILQAYSAGLMSRRTAIERLGYVEDVDAELQRIEQEESERRSMWSD